MAKPKCGYCGEKVAKRYCPSLDKLLCPVCCGTNRLKNISCEDDCRYLDYEEYQQRVASRRNLMLFWQKSHILNIMISLKMKV